MNPLPEISVVIAVYNGTEHLAGKNYVQAMGVRVYWRARIGLRNLFRQGFSQGRSQVLSYRKYRDRAAQRRSLITSLRASKKPSMHATDISARRYPIWGASLGGYAVGRSKAFAPGFLHLMLAT
jgi:hypothetical protein